MRAVASVVLAAFVVASCGTTRTIDMGAPAGFADEVRPGDRVSTTTRDGRELAFDVVRVEPDALVGVEERVERDQIAPRRDALRRAT